MGNYKFIFQTRRNVAALLVIFAGVFFALRVLGNAPARPAEQNVSVPELKPSATYEALLEASHTSSLDPAENITETLVQEYSEEVFRLNQDKAGQTAITPSELITPPDEFLGALIAQREGEALSVPLFQTSDISILATSSDKAAITYADAYQAISARNLEDVSTPYLTAVYESTLESRHAELRAHVRASSLQVRDLLELKVPEPLAEFHVELLNVWRRREAIGVALLDQKDPLRQTLALNALPDAIDREVALFALLFSAQQQP